MNPALNEGLPAFLAPGAGLNSGFMMPQVTGMELHAQLQKLAPEQASRMVFVTGGAFTDAGGNFEIAGLAIFLPRTRKKSRSKDRMCSRLYPVICGSLRIASLA